MESTAREKRLIEHGQTSDVLVYGGAELVVIDTPLARVHLDERIPDDIVDERPRVDLAQDEAQRVRRRVGQQHELVPRQSLVQVQSVL